VASEEAGDVRFVSGCIIAWEQDGATGETGLDGIERGFGLAFRTGGPSGELGVLLIGGDLLGGGHGGSFFWTFRSRTVVARKIRMAHAGNLPRCEPDRR
jgi:hypothetical protein